jgi:hypothetical protein
LKPAELITLTTFGALCVAGLTASILQSARQRARLQRYAEERGGSFIRKPDEDLPKYLQQQIPEEDRVPGSVAVLEPPPERVLLLSCQVSARSGRKSSEVDMTCLAEYPPGTCDGLVDLIPRIPVLEHMVADRVQVGAEDFLKEFNVLSNDPEVARRLLNARVQRVLIEARTSPGWNMGVIFTPRFVLVETTWARTPEDWDALVGLTRKLREAVR